jgi:hypothetical protein
VNNMEQQRTKEEILFSIIEMLTVAHANLIERFDDNHSMQCIRDLADEGGNQ